MKDTNQLLKLSAKFESRKQLLERARIMLCISQNAYQRHLELAERAYHEDVILNSPNGYKTNPFVTPKSRREAEEDSEKWLSISDRVYRHHEIILTSLFISGKTVQDFY